MKSAESLFYRVDILHEDIEVVMKHNPQDYVRRFLGGGLIVNDQENIRIKHLTLHPSELTPAISHLISYGNKLAQQQPDSEAKRSLSNSFWTGEEQLPFRLVVLENILETLRTPAKVSTSKVR